MEVMYGSPYRYFNLLYKSNKGDLYLTRHRCVKFPLRCGGGIELNNVTQSSVTKMYLIYLAEVESLRCKIPLETAKGKHPHFRLCHNVLFSTTKDLSSSGAVSRTCCHVAVTVHTQFIDCV